MVLLGLQHKKVHLQLAANAEPKTNGLVVTIDYDEKQQEQEQESN
jgi:hypothetical protein